VEQSRKIYPHPELDRVLYVPLTQGYVALVDAEYACVGDSMWCALLLKNGPYACRFVSEAGTRQIAYLHRVIYELANGQIPDKIQVDHVNRNGLDCRISNLRLATNTQNQANKGRSKNNASGFKGVSWSKRVGKFAAYIKVDGKNKFLGYFDVALDAALVYDEAVISLRGEFAKTNASLGLL
jgi:hypothetical protein